MPKRYVNGARKKETLQPGVFMRAKDHGLGEEQFDRISCTIAYAASYDKDKVWFRQIRSTFSKDDVCTVTLKR